MNTFTCCKCDASSHLMSIEFRIVFSTSRGTLFTFPAVRREIWLSHWQPTFDCEIKVPADVLTTFFYFKLNAVRGRKCKSPRQRDVTWASAARSDAFTPRGPQTKSKPIGQKDDISFLQFIPNKTRIAEKIDRRVAELWTKHANESLPTIQVGRKI